MANEDTKVTPTSKCVFVLVYQDIEILQLKIKKVCAVFCMEEYALPKYGRGTTADYNQELSSISLEMTNILTTLNLSESQLTGYIQDSLTTELDTVKYSSLEIFRLYAEKEKRTFEAMNMMK